MWEISLGVTAILFCIYTGYILGKQIKANEVEKEAYRSGYERGYAVGVEDGESYAKRMLRQFITQNVLREERRV
jgi:hypothetical protein